MKFVDSGKTERNVTNLHYRLHYSLLQTHNGDCRLHILQQLVVIRHRLKSAFETVFPMHGFHRKILINLVAVFARGTLLTALN